MGSQIPHKGKEMDREAPDRIIALHRHVTCRTVRFHFTFDLNALARDKKVSYPHPTVELQVVGVSLAQSVFEAHH